MWEDWHGQCRRSRGYRKSGDHHEGHCRIPASPIDPVLLRLTAAVSEREITGAGLLAALRG